MLVLGLGGAVVNIATVSVSGMSLAAVVGVLLNLLLPKDDEEVPGKNGAASTWKLKNAKRENIAMLPKDPTNE